RACRARALLASHELFGVVEPLLPTLKEMGVGVWVMGKGPYPPGVVSLQDLLEEASEEPLPYELSTPRHLMDTCLYIFTSGTTGLPKAAKVSHLKTILCLGFYKLVGASSSDVIYLTLPLYHMSGSLLGILGTFGLVKDSLCSRLGHDGRAGMATLVLQPDADFDGPQIYQHVAELLPPYAWPRFLRLQEQLEMTETFKQKRFRLVEEGFDPSRITDPLFVLDVTARTYVPLTLDLWRKIAAGELRLKKGSFAEIGRRRNEIHSISIVRCLGKPHLRRDAREFAERTSPSDSEPFGTVVGCVCVFKPSLSSTD
ncbi:PREDICTED: long-chain fatty acid transport protein 3-like, partial [Thamnophis sirtalis]|uniref:long-chain-fatty-acid--CoA ligase n=1 Tax=Thamnophis sirtalis TaxID=35019 RepID=A0A6I9XYU8_9SAUR